MRPVEELCEVLRDRRMKVTPQRRSIFEVVYGTAEHPTAEDICHRVREVMPDVSLATVYQTLNGLVSMGEVVELDLGEGKTRYDPSTDGHWHLVCLGCRQIVDVPRSVDPAEILLEEPCGYEITRCDVVLYGRCPNCQR